MPSPRKRKNLVYGTGIEGERKENLRAKPLSGTLSVAIQGARELDHAPIITRFRSSKNQVVETSVSLKVEGTRLARSHPSRTDPLSFLALSFDSLQRAQAEEILCLRNLAGASQIFRLEESLAKFGLNTNLPPPSSVLRAALSTLTGLTTPSTVPGSPTTNSTHSSSSTSFSSSSSTSNTASRFTSTFCIIWIIIRICIDLIHLLACSRFTIYIGLPSPGSHRSTPSFSTSSEYNELDKSDGSVSSFDDRPTRGQPLEDSFQQLLPSKPGNNDLPGTSSNFEAVPAITVNMELIGLQLEPDPPDPVIIPTATSSSTALSSEGSTLPLPLSKEANEKASVATTERTKPASAPGGGRGGRFAAFPVKKRAPTSTYRSVFQSAYVATSGCETRIVNPVNARPTTCYPYWS
ncbi:uncharacterized protein C8R40DRAFT_1167750 [Lentinula edodes]|uniref:uncharacterized protein n=1 Tax=Lentinula edodes TaxID=5353 RepID=UPI001E8DA158|nr:uncharacterized protein C8R40DRAFT_1167750 [Lentinula edodes]KAH7878325.1 hypothetical protein C8R40DRAFT_1167750 [Lentinula edodes]